MTTIIVEQEILLRTVLDRSTFVATLVYSNADPYAVRLVLPAPGDEGPVAWDFARQLIADGLTRKVGIGDVQVWPCTGSVGLTLRSPDGTATVLVNRRELAQFLARTYAVVAGGQEPQYCDWDEVVALLLA